ncbi:MAG: patatin-like phospholipase family protein, partial [Caldilineales bacterium]|nr:patatin-like phospholipase family protein [Caldilineales bacterium]
GYTALILGSVGLMTVAINTSSYREARILRRFRATPLQPLAYIAADVTAGMMLVLNHRTAPDLPVVWATRMSMSVPLLWEEVVWRPEWGRYRGRELAGHAIVDGGLLSNFPIELFLSSAPQVTAVMGDGQGHEVLGFLIDENLPVPGAPPLAVKNEGGLSLEELTTVQRLKHLVDTAIQAHDKAVIEAFEHLVVRLPARGYGTTEFAMSPERRDALIAAGREVTHRYLDRRLAPADIATTPAPFDPETLATQRALRLLGE